MRRGLIFCAACLFGLFQLPAEAQSSPQKEKAAAPKTTADSANAQSEGLDARVEKYLRNLYAWGPDYSVKVGPAKPSAIPELLEVRVAVSLAGQSDTAVVYVSKNGGFLIRGELSDMSVDPFAETRSKLPRRRIPNFWDPRTPKSPSSSSPTSSARPAANST